MLTISHLFLVFLFIDFDIVNVSWVPPYQFINDEITYFRNYQQIHKNFSEITAYKKGLWSELVAPKTFFLCRLLSLITQEKFLSEYSVSLFHESSCGLSFLNGYYIYFRRALLAMHCVYAMYLTDILSRAYCYFKEALTVNTFEWYGQYFRRPFAMI